MSYVAPSWHIAGLHAAVFGANGLFRSRQLLGRASSGEPPLPPAEYLSANAARQRCAPAADSYLALVLLGCARYSFTPPRVPPSSSYHVSANPANTKKP
eukprot:6671757-Pyramimonas_sp.AAC.1